MTKWQTFKALRTAMKDPDRIADVAVYKSELAGTRARASVEAQLEGLAHTFPTLDPAALGRLPRGTLGRGYAEFLAARDLRPFRLSGAISSSLLARNIFVARYGLLHDVFHVLTGFDTSLAGELGVWSFVAAQGYAASHWVAVAMACVLYPLRAPRQIPRLARNLRLGMKMGSAAKTLIAVPFETMWDRPLEDVRAELFVRPAHELDATLAPRLTSAQA